MPVLRLAAQPAEGRKRRSESFFGLHFDLHPGEKDTALGRDVNEAMIERLLAAAAPDYVQYDAKGHAGWLGWPSQVGPSSPGIVQDSLRLWRDVTARRGVALYIHFSGVWDGEAVKRRPEWARLDREGKPDGRNTSTFGPYVDELMIPQLREAATRYELDGVWVDGECWSVQPDYAAAAVKAWGRGEPPRGPEDALWQEWLEFHRERFRQYVKHYADALHASHPKLQVASNWLYSTFVPEAPALPVDFLSGDYLGNASISRARLEARYLAQTGKPWDLMAWGFQQAQSNTVGHVHKPAVQLQQEAGVVLAQGGGFQIYYQPSRAGHFEESHIRVMGEVGRFCRARQAVSHQTETAPQIGVVMSRESLYRTTNRLFGGWGRADAPAVGWLDALVACQWSVDVIPDWKLAQSAASYPFIVLPDWAAPGEAALSALLTYAEKGGRLLVAGAANARAIAERTGLTLRGEAAEQSAYLGRGEVLGNHRGLWQDVEGGAWEVVEERYPALDSTRDGRPAAVGRAFGAGRLLVVPGPTGAVYAGTHAPAIRDFVKRLVRPHFTPLVEVEGPPTLEVALRRKDGRLLVHLLNCTGMQVAGEWAAIDYVPPVGPVKLTFRGVKPRRVEVAPGGKVLRPPYLLERLEVHAVVAVTVAG